MLPALSYQIDAGGTNIGVGIHGYKAFEASLSSPARESRGLDGRLNDQRNGIGDDVVTSTSVDKPRRIHSTFRVNSWSCLATLMMFS